MGKPLDTTIADYIDVESNTAEINIEYKIFEDDIKKSRHWDVVDTVDPNEYDQDRSERFEKLMNSMFK